VVLVRQERRSSTTPSRGPLRSAGHRETPLWPSRCRAPKRRGQVRGVGGELLETLRSAANPQQVAAKTFEFSRPVRFTTRVVGPCRASTATFDPTATMRSPSRATASAKPPGASDRPVLDEFCDGDVSVIGLGCVHGQDRLQG
jgi:hypothetical protein